MKMKVNLYESKSSRSMVVLKQDGVENSITYGPVGAKGKKQAKFVEDAKKYLEDQLGTEDLELDIRLKTVREAQAMTTEKIEEVLSTKGAVTNPTLREILNEVYISRTGDYIPDPALDEEEQPKPEKAPAPKKEPKAKAKKEKKEPAEPKEPRSLKKMLSDEELQKRLESARTHKGKVVEFLCTKTKQQEYGVIRSARLDKRTGFIQFRIEILDTHNTLGFTGKKAYCTGQMYGKGDDSSDLNFLNEDFISETFPAIPDPEPEKKPAEAKAKKEKKQPEPVKGEETKEAQNPEEATDPAEK